MIEEIKIPDIGENVETGDVVKLLVKVGDVIEAEQGIVELETDKAVVEIPSQKAGKITELLIKEGDQVAPGQVIGKIDSEGKAAAKPKAAERKQEVKPEPEPKVEEQSEPEPEPEPQRKPKKVELGPKPTPPPTGKAAPAAPSVRRLARELGVPIHEVTGSGPGGRILAEDVKNFVRSRMSDSAPATHEQPLPDFSQWGSIVREPMTKVRKLTARSMSQAWTTVPHVTQFDDADITLAEEFREKYAGKVEKSDGKLTITAILLKVVASALQQFPKFNASIDTQHEELILKQYYHVGLAVDTERGLLVPVIRDVDKKGIKELAIELTQLADRTRRGKVSVDELEGGTFTISNQGGIGGTNFSPIVYWPQVAILGMSRSRVQPVWDGDEFEPRVILPLSLSYDHRIIDGAEAARFLSWICEALEQPFTLQF